MLGIKRICIVGGGNVGISCAVDISQNENYEIILLTSKVQLVRKQFIKIVSETHETIHSKNVCVTNDCKKAYANADLVIVTLPSFCIDKFSTEISSFSPKMILFIPGYGGKEFYMQEMRKKGCIIAGLDRSPYVCRLVNDNTVFASKKKSLKIGCLGNTNLDNLCHLIEELFEIVCSSTKNYLSITFTPSNPILHTSRLYSMFSDSNLDSKFTRMIKFYAEWNDSSSQLLFEMDSELQKICETYSDFDLTGVIPLPKHYESKTIVDLTNKITSIESWHNLDSPMKKNNDDFYSIDIDSRYFQEDFSFGLLILKDFALLSKVPTPTFDKVLKWFSTLSGNMIDLNSLNFLSKFGITEKNDIYGIY